MPSAPEHKQEYLLTFLATGWSYDDLIYLPIISKPSLLEINFWNMCNSERYLQHFGRQFLQVNKNAITLKIIKNIICWAVGPWLTAKISFSKHFGHTFRGHQWGKFGLLRFWTFFYWGRPPKVWPRVTEAQAIDHGPTVLTCLLYTSRCV